MLPARADRPPFWSAHGKNCRKSVGEDRRRWARQARVVKLTGGMTESEYEPRRALPLTRNTDDYAIRRASSLDVDPVTLSSEIPTVAAFGHHTVDIWQQLEPVFGIAHVSRPGHKLLACGGGHD